MVSGSESNSSKGCFNGFKKSSRFGSSRHSNGISSASHPPVNVINPAKLEALKIDVRLAIIEI